MQRHARSLGCTRTRARTLAQSDGTQRTAFRSFRRRSSTSARAEVRARMMERASASCLMLTDRARARAHADRHAGLPVRLLVLLLAPRAPFVPLSPEPYVQLYNDEILGAPGVAVARERVHCRAHRVRGEEACVALGRGQHSSRRRVADAPLQRPVHRLPERRVRRAVDVADPPAVAAAALDDAAPGHVCAVQPQRERVAGSPPKDDLAPDPRVGIRMSMGPMRSAAERPGYLVRRAGDERCRVGARQGQHKDRARLALPQPGHAHLRHRELDAPHDEVRCGVNWSGARLGRCAGLARGRGMKWHGYASGLSMDWAWAWHRGGHANGRLPSPTHGTGPKIRMHCAVQRPARFALALTLSAPRPLGLSASRPLGLSQVLSASPPLAAARFPRSLIGTAPVPSPSAAPARGSWPGLWTRTSSGAASVRPPAQRARPSRMCATHVPKLSPRLTADSSRTLLSSLTTPLTSTNAPRW